uniref:Peptidase C51 domain-containing protein n=1 Tax=Trypanosoma congolense (strain IL3000) TaxID=1068625 RepID=G0UJX0_TRYCI|nr:conserved hypothetical protein [Trypanosoma congolense IL3000]
MFKLKLNRKQQLQIAVPATVMFVLLTFALLGVKIFGSTKPEERHLMHMDFNPLQRCNTPLDSVLGYASEIPAISNCHRHWTSESDAYAAMGYPDDVVKGKPYSSLRQYVYTGSCWNADEFVNRYIFLTRAIMAYFGGGKHEDYWSSLTFFGSSGMHRKYQRIDLMNGMTVKTLKGRKKHAPRVGDIVVWKRDFQRYFERGHVAVVVKVEGDAAAAGGETRLAELQKEQQHPLLVYIAEQNFDNKHWMGRNFSRVLKFSWKSGNQAVIEDPDGPPIKGHARVGKLLYHNEEF